MNILESLHKLLGGGNTQPPKQSPQQSVAGPGASPQQNVQQNAANPSFLRQLVGGTLQTDPAHNVYRRPPSVDTQAVRDTDIFRNNTPSFSIPNERRLQQYADVNGNTWLEDNNDGSRYPMPQARQNFDAPVESGLPAASNGVVHRYDIRAKMPVSRF